MLIKRRTLATVFPVSNVAVTSFMFTKYAFGSPDVLGEVSNFKFDKHDFVGQSKQ